MAGRRGQDHTFQASVIRASVPVPERSQDGLLLGFIDNWEEATVKAEGRPADHQVDLLPANGPAISLISPPVRLVPRDRWLSFSVPDDFKLIFVESGTITVRLGASGAAPIDVAARVGDLSAGEGYRLYGLVFEGVEDPDAHRKLVDTLSA